MSKSHMLFLVYGASGSGKSTLLDMVSDLSSDISIHKKDTDRKPRPLEKGKILKEINFKKHLNLKDYVLIYKQWGFNYGIRKDLLLKSFMNHEIHFIIIGNITTLKKMKSLYPYAVALYVHYAPEEIPKRFKERDPLEFKQREKRITLQYKDYIKNNTLFDHTIINFWELENAKTQLKNIINVYNKKFDFDLLKK